jgi:hypothetical protein
MDAAAVASRRPGWVSAGRLIIANAHGGVSAEERVLRQQERLPGLHEITCTEGCICAEPLQARLT